MCGVTCIINLKKKINLSTLSAMTTALEHRGPDAKVIKHFEHGTMGLGNTRLSLVDLSHSGDQPMEKHDLAITFNGEIYNYQELRALLEGIGYTFFSTTDTEVILTSIHHWGLEKSLELFNGCFAFILLDKAKQKVFAVRDHLGEKQLVYTKGANGDILFASEIKSLLKHPYVKAIPSIDRFISIIYMDMSADQSKTFFQNIFTIPPGAYMIVDLTKTSNPRLKSYWNLDEISPIPYTKKDLVDISTTFLHLLDDAVRLRVHADTKIGSILSGGIDSSFISALATKHNKSPLLCFNTSYKKDSNEDLLYARLLARKNKHIQLKEIQPPNNITKKELLHITKHLEEPMVTKIHFATYHNYAKVHEAHIKGVINGQGADELWLGYFLADNMYQQLPRVYQMDNFVHFWFDRAMCSPFVENHGKKRIEEVIRENLESTYSFKKDMLSTLQSFSIRTHLSTILHFEDTLSMANSVEVRLPYLDRRIVSFALSISPSLKIFDKKEKYINRIAARGILPQALIQRSKQGFPNPPTAYDQSFKKLMGKKELFKSEVLRNIFTKEAIEKMEEKLPLPATWYLYAIALMEQVYFN